MKLKLAPSERNCTREDYEFALAAYSLNPNSKDFKAELETGMKFVEKDAEAIQRANIICRSIRILVRELGIETSPDNEAFAMNLVEAMHETDNDTYVRTAEEVAAVLGVHLIRDMEERLERGDGLSITQLMIPMEGEQKEIDKLPDDEKFEFEGGDKELSFKELKRNPVEVGILFEYDNDYGVSDRLVTSILNVFSNACIFHLGDLLTYSQADLRKFRHFGGKSFKAIDKRLNDILGVNISSVTADDRKQLKALGFGPQKRLNPGQDLAALIAQNPENFR